MFSYSPSSATHIVRQAACHYHTLTAILNIAIVGSGENV